MKSIDIYYFTGTGNSYYIAKRIAVKTGGKLIAIADVVKNKSIETEAKTLVIVFPVYYVDIPLIVKDFAEKLLNIETKYIYAVTNYGGGFMQIPLNTPMTLFTGKGELLGHSGSTGSFAFYYPYKEFFFVGDLNQLANPALPIYLLMNLAMRMK